MNLTRLLLTSTTALGLSMTTALADGNDAFLDQIGTDNSALIEQNGSNASAGDSNPQRRMTQDGDDNVLVILQSAEGRVGTGSNYAQNNLGVDQLGDRNLLDVTQDFGSRVFEVQQNSNGATSPVIDVANTATIVQTGNMRVSRVRQTYTGNGASGTGNSLTVTQSGGEFQQSGIGDFNGFNPAFAKQGVWQEGTSNSATVTQINAGQSLWLLDQLGETNSFTLTQGGGNGNKFQTAEQFGNDNVATFEFSGSNNGNGTLSGAALASGAPNRSLLQNGDGNMMAMTVLTVTVPTRGTLKRDMRRQLSPIVVRAMTRMLLTTKD
ncbi:hypothetical protein, partial [Marivita sp.]|uniref:hypothetical protein n=1 Tax=Marivita sp. TaxID=2003365 RepID=UPI0025BE3C3A